jgi:hypothetical protein
MLKRFREFVGKKVIGAGIKIMTSDQNGNIVINGYESSIVDNRETVSAKGFVIVYDAYRTRATLELDPVIFPS